MFDIGFTELAMVAVVALVVIGPEKLPSVARNVGAWTGRIKRTISSVQADINAELNSIDDAARSNPEISEKEEKEKSPNHDFDPTSFTNDKGIHAAYMNFNEGDKESSEDKLENTDSTDNKKEILESTQMEIVTSKHEPA